MMVKGFFFSTFCLGEFIKLVLPLQLNYQPRPQRNPLQTLWGELFTFRDIYFYNLFWNNGSIGLYSKSKTY